MECRLEDVYSSKRFNNVISNVDNPYLDEHALNENVKIDYDKCKSVLFKKPAYNYLKSKKSPNVKY